MTFSNGQPSSTGTGFGSGSIGGPGRFVQSSFDGRRTRRVRVPRPGPDQARAAARVAKYLLWLVPILFLLTGPLFDEQYPDLDFGPILCAAGVEPMLVTFVFDDSGSLFWNDPNQRRYEEAREVTEWWADESCRAEDAVAVLHFDDVVAPVAPTAVRGFDLVDRFAYQASSSSTIAPSLARAVDWSIAGTGPDVIVVMSDGINPDPEAGLAQLRRHSEAEVVFVSLGGPPPPAWQVGVVDDVFVLDDRPPLGVIGSNVAQVIRDRAETT